MRLYLMVLAIFGQGNPVPSYLIRTDDGINVLIDTGFSPEMIAASQQSDTAEQYIRDAVPITDHLATLGLAPTDIHYLIATHFDPDHAGAHDAFPNAEIVVQRAHYQMAKGGTDRRYTMNQSHWDAPGLRYRFVDGDTELLPGITLIETSGHVPGHQSVLVRLNETGPVLLTIDAINYAGQRDPDTRTVAGYDMDEASTRASTRKLRDLVAHEGVRLVIYGHDRKQWPTLKKAPAYYT
ncbi:MAG: N-acyl homoserine lactonase family protein [Thermomicrobia bacterium]|nr:N-acyl homoserine lactonase family protein [Thermomicrobia bacterium]